MVDREAALPRRGGRHRRVQDRRRRARLGPRPASTPTAARGDEGNNLFPVHYAKAFGDLLRSHGQGARDVQPRRLHRVAGARRVLGRRRELDVGGVPLVDLRGASAAACGIVYWGWDLAGFSGDGARRRALPAGRRGVRRSCRSCSTTPSSTTTARRRATARRGTSPSSPATIGSFRSSAGSPSCASGWCPTSRPRRRESIRTSAPLMRAALLRPPRRWRARGRTRCSGCSAATCSSHPSSTRARPSTRSPCRRASGSTCGRARRRGRRRCCGARFPSTRSRSTAAPRHGPRLAPVFERARVSVRRRGCGRLGQPGRPGRRVRARARGRHGGLLGAQPRGLRPQAHRPFADPQPLRRLALAEPVGEQVVDLPALGASPIAQFDEQPHEGLGIRRRLVARDRQPCRRLLRPLDGVARVDEGVAPAGPHARREAESRPARSRCRRSTCRGG